MENTISPFARPLYIMTKPIGAVCNMKCEYCYYLEKKDLYPERTNYVMSDDLLELFVEQYLKAQTMNEVQFTWHGGEALLRPISFYEKAIVLQQKYGEGKRIDNSIQTNGTLLTDEWCQFFKKHHFLVGISIDGPKDCHDVYRKMNNNQPSFDHVMRGIQLLQKHEVDFNIMAVVNNYNVDYPLEFYRFFKDLNVQFIQFTPIVERIGTDFAPWNVPADKWGKFLITIFKEWVKADVGKIFIQYFDATLANWVGVKPGVCTLSKNCGHAGVMEFNGDVYSCDHFVSPEYKLGNISSSNLVEMMYSKKQMEFGMDKSKKLPTQCQSCKYLFACNGECPKNRIISTKTGEKGLNYLCEGYYQFFDYVAPYMDFMKNELLNGRSVERVMKL